MSDSADERWMRLAIGLARKGTGAVHPNPLVGAVLVRGGKVVGRGYHARFGGPHAEAAAIRAAGRRARGATLYVTLEPCDHQGKTPPCSEAIVSAGIRRVVTACEDPHPLVRGRGISRLRRAGLSVTRGVCREQARRINEDYLRWVVTGMPSVTLKLAQTLDGKIAVPSGESRWISGRTSRVYAHALRAASDAVLVGVGTALADDPRLDVRLTRAEALRAGRLWGFVFSAHAKPPLKVIVDSRLRVSERARCFARTPKEGIVLAVTPRASKRRIRRLESKARVWVLPADAKGRVDLAALLKRLAAAGFLRVLAEGGGRLAASLLAGRLVGRVVFVVAPKILGGRDVASVADLGIGRLDRAVRLERLKSSQAGEDWLLEGEVRHV